VKKSRVENLLSGEGYKKKKKISLRARESRRILTKESKKEKGKALPTIPDGLGGAKFCAYRGQEGYWAMAKKKESVHHQW